MRATPPPPPATPSDGGGRDEPSAAVPRDGGDDRPAGASVGARGTPVPFGPVRPRLAGALGDADLVAILRRCASGDPEGVAELRTWQGGRIARTYARLVRDPELAEGGLAAVLGVLAREARDYDPAAGRRPRTGCSAGCGGWSWSRRAGRPRSRRPRAPAGPGREDARRSRRRSGNRRSGRPRRLPPPCRRRHHRTRRDPPAARRDSIGRSRTRARSGGTPLTERPRRPACRRRSRASRRDGARRYRERCGSRRPPRRHGLAAAGAAACAASSPSWSSLSPRPPGPSPVCATPDSGRVPSPLPPSRGRT
jgi:hypothetical protein